MQKDISLFASKDEQISRINVLIRDGLNEIQACSEEISAASDNMPRGTTASHKNAIKAGRDTINNRIMGIGTDYK